MTTNRPRICEPAFATVSSALLFEGYERDKAARQIRTSCDEDCLLQD
jgi:hypothetical protein